jgi:two-component system C4-dicarboxylate transport sensor histidine kinase DctB
VGKNYGFRPYFKQALASEPWVYMAQGVIPHKQGIYYNHPVVGETPNDAIGVVVIKNSVHEIGGIFRFLI